MFRRFLILLSVAVVVSSFHTLNNSRRLVGLHEGTRKTNVLGGNNNRKALYDTKMCKWDGAGASFLATMIVCGTLLSSPESSAAQMLTPESSLQTIRTAESTDTSSTSSSAASLLGDSFWTLSDNFDANQKSLAETLKERAMEKARELQEKQQAAAAERDARNKAFDDLFDQAEKERNEYYSKRIISRDTYLQNLREQEENQGGGTFDPQASPAQELKDRLEQNLQEENKLRLALVENRQKDQDSKETRVERTLLKIALEKSENETAKLRKDIALADSIETIKLQRQAEVRVYQERADAREKDKQEAMESIRKIKERETAAFEELRARKRQELEDLKFASSQSSFERRFNDIERFDQRKNGLESNVNKEETIGGTENESNPEAEQASTKQ